MAIINLIKTQRRRRVIVFAIAPPRQPRLEIGAAPKKKSLGLTALAAEVTLCVRNVHSPPRLRLIQIY